MTDKCAEPSADRADKGKGGGMREVVWFCGKSGFNHALDSDLGGGDAMWCSIGG